MTIDMSTYISGTHDPTDLLHRVEIRAQTTVHGENLLVDDRRNRQTVEAVGERLPELDVVSSLALVVESIDTVDRGTLVVAAQNEEILRILDLVCQEQTNGFERLLATIHVVTKEEVVGFRGKSTVFEQTKEIVVLSVDVTANLRKTDQKTCQTRVLREMSEPGNRSRTLMGASSSSRMGCEMKISRALVQRKRISDSSNCTCLPGRLPLTSKRRSMIESKSTSWSAMTKTH